MRRLRYSPRAMFFIPGLNIRKGVSVAGLLAALSLAWFWNHWPELLDRHEKEVAAVPVAMQICRTHEDCGAVETSCSSCCNYQPINKAFEQDYYRDELTPHCTEYKGPVCDCAVSPFKSLCIDGRCRMQPIPHYNE